MDLDPGILAQAKIGFAALCGGVTRLLFRPAETFLKTAWLLFGCVTCGYYGTAPFIRWFDLAPDDAGAVGALIGFIGLSLAQGALVAADKFDVTAWLLKRNGQ